MKILYGIQGTGNGHITRARAMAVELKKVGIDVDYLVSGRARDKLFDMEVFGDFQHRDGLTFTVKDGQILPFQTVLNAKPLTFLRDIQALDLSRYDRVLCDYEPITAWAGISQKIPVIGLGHQYAFRHAIPQHRGSPAQRWLMRYFAPTSQFLGLHWHHFGQPILPPIAPVDEHYTCPVKGQIIVYLPFENTSAIDNFLAPFGGCHFKVYHPDAAAHKQRGRTLPHIEWHSPSRNGFQADLQRSEGVVCNAGFELASEALQLGKKLLVKPVKGQPEQFANALALDILGYGHTMKHLEAPKLEQWLREGCATRILYPNVAEAISQWLVEGAEEPVAELSKRLWERTAFPDLTATTRVENHVATFPNTTDCNQHRTIAHG